jgi:hypothetical protein
MGTSKTMGKSKKLIDRDEYYTLYEDISNELPRYKEQFKGKRILCPCDWDESYDEEIIFRSKKEVHSNDIFGGGSIKEIDIQATNNQIKKDISLIKCNFAKFLIAHAEDYGIESISVSGYNPITGKGVKFQDIDYSNYDLIVTNPPFSQIEELFHILIKNKKEFLVIGPLSALDRQGLFNYFRENKMWLGYAKQLKGFMRPDGTLLLSKDKEGSIPRACKWYTNLDVSYRHDFITLTESYYENPDRYPKALNYDCIIIDGVKNIPMDYEGKMAVTANIMSKLNPDQFEIIGLSPFCAEKPDFDVPKEKRGGPQFYFMKNGELKRGFTSMVIKNKKPVRYE